MTVSATEQSYLPRSAKIEFLNRYERPEKGRETHCHSPYQSSAQGERYNGLSARKVANRDLASANPLFRMLCTIRRTEKITLEELTSLLKLQLQHTASSLIIRGLNDQASLFLFSSCGWANSGINNHLSSMPTVASSG